MSADGKGFVECRSWSLGKNGAPWFSRSELVDYLTASERSTPDVLQMTSTPLRSIQSLLVVILHDYWLAKYVMHVLAVDQMNAAVCDGAGERPNTAVPCIHPGTLYCRCKNLKGIALAFHGNPSITELRSVTCQMGSHTHTCL